MPSFAVDLRSDTVTLPTPRMMEEITKAKLGDDILEEDPTVHALEQKAAELLGMEASMLVISGTMANQIAVMTFAERGEEVILGKDTHLYNLEGAGLAAISQVQARPIEVVNRYYDPEKIERVITTGDIQHPKTALISLENTYNLNKGQVISLENMQAVKQLADQYQLPIFLDGARLFNATVALNVTPAEMCQYVDAVQFCLTKGLGCPLGSILAGSKDFIERAKINRQRIGGGMRQAGIIAAPGIYALDHRIKRLKEDHERAKKLAKQLSKVHGLEIDLKEVQSNIISPKITHKKWEIDAFIDRLAKEGIKVKKISESEFRMIVHYHVTDEKLTYVIKTFQRLLEA